MPRAHNDNEARLLAYLAAGIRSSEEIQKRLGLSQPKVSRLITGLRDKVVAIGRARSRRYTLRRDVRGLGGDFPVFSIDPDGNASSLGVLRAVGHDEYLWQPKSGEAVSSKSLPWFLADLRPDGFTGRAFVRRLHEHQALPPRVLDWHDDHVLAAISRRGEDFIGDLIVGQESLARPVFPPDARVRFPHSPGRASGRLPRPGGQSYGRPTRRILGGGRAVQVYRMYRAGGGGTECPGEVLPSHGIG